MITDSWSEYSNQLLFILTAYPFSVIVDVLDSQWGEHYTNRLSWHTHLGTVYEKPKHIQTHSLRLST